MRLVPRIALEQPSTSITNYCMLYNNKDTFKNKEYITATNNVSNSQPTERQTIEM